MAVLIGFLGFVAFVVLATWLWNKVFLSFPATFATRSIRLFEGWALSRGSFWPLVGMNLLALVLAIAVAFVVGILGAILQFGTMGGLVVGQGLDLTNPAFLTGIGVSMTVRLVGAVVQMVLLYAPQAEAYRQLTDRDRAAEAF
jgi:ABC-type glycerol-3-phosphate transport system permease component